MSKLYNEVKYIHLMVNNKFNKPFVDFLNKNFNPKEHIVLCKRCFDFPFPEGDNVIEVEDNFYSMVDFRNPNFKKIICHSLFDAELIDYFYENQDILKEKAHWQIWGGDLYDAIRDEKNDFVRSHFKGYITECDEEYARKKYAMQGTFYDAAYFSPISHAMIEDAKNYKLNRPSLNIQINNSADYSTLEMLAILAKFKDENIEVCTVVSYGEMKYGKEILAKGKEIFGEKFYAFTTYMPPELYARHLANQNILIFNQNRQQGGANIAHGISLGAKIFIKKDNSRSKKLKEVNIVIYDTEDIANMSFEEFAQNTCAEENRINLGKIHTRKGTLKERWQKVFEE